MCSFSVCLKIDEKMYSAAYTDKLPADNFATKRKIHRHMNLEFGKFYVLDIYDIFLTVNVFWFCEAEHFGHFRQRRQPWLNAINNYTCDDDRVIASFQSLKWQKVFMFCHLWPPNVTLMHLFWFYLQQCSHLTLVSLACTIYSAIVEDGVKKFKKKKHHSNVCMDVAKWIHAN